MNNVKFALLCLTTMAIVACQNPNKNPNGENPEEPNNPPTTITITTGEVTDITCNSATILSSVDIDASSYVEVGIIYSTTYFTPTSYSGYIVRGEFVDANSFSTTLTDLSEETQYWYCAYAELNGQTQYGAVQQFTTGGRITFSVGDGKYVVFSKGNLQYQPSTRLWRFAEHQYDYYSRFAGGAIGSTGWADLFCWGTGDNPTNDEANSYFADWGNNKIGDDAPYTWRTLTSEEWEYLFSYRLNSMSLYGTAVVNNINGLIILPDKWTLPTELTFKSNASSWKENTYTIAEWQKMEKNGAIFLPAVGCYSDYYSKYRSIQEKGYYWSSNNAFYYYYMYFYGNSNIDRGYTDENDGCSVRLVQDL